ncbi:MAG TPA: prepilin-type N-terminal cleavage/methylation domain-containing protein [Candidatus Didemnitutus sp.]|nr:prepilin-type N-terminal cleavage/methylation domain-containing protein [Candidatus Didemnitutus sp.]
MSWLSRGFSLVEVVAALAVVVLAVLPALAFLPTAVSEEMRQRDRQTAEGLLDALRVAAGEAPTDVEGGLGSLVFGAARDGTGLHPIQSDPAPGEYFLCSLEPVPGDVPPASSAEFAVTVWWPFRRPSGAAWSETPASAREQRVFRIRVRR